MFTRELQDIGLRRDMRKRRSYGIVPTVEHLESRTLLSITIGSPTADPTVAGVLDYAIHSPYEAVGPTNGGLSDGSTILRVLTPTNPAPGKAARVLYVLPVEEGVVNTWGDPMSLAAAQGTANAYNMTIVEPTFNEIPWFADNSQNPGICEESYMLKAVVPAMETIAPNAAAGGSLLTGFSKSGWGGLNLLMRNSSVFAGGAFFDSPFDLSNTSQYEGMTVQFANQANLNSLLDADYLEQ